MPDKVKFTGTKWSNKEYHSHSGYVGGLKTRTAKEQRSRKPDMLLMSAVKGMLPKNSLGRRQLKKLKIFSGETHNHSAQNPQPIELK